ncbi:glycoside hydrolase family 2 TIM barrel-domain containing protein [Aestuariibaculum sp. YM273]|uniref:sugar-binding domain-containing protein n=1 Tax=Aestuariibaculum sp. YM273 TaxID=3070659 RepID=UPI0027DE0D04|nr:sugar-binding domain-containing protein [Aestuariibaculum sp. YM273]WMI65695.1 glycoside hydrolase family 2 TIM barrel-domain containing protein [Aestuariibaculum sp. YM273]
MLKNLGLAIFSLTLLCFTNCANQKQNKIERKQLFNYDWKFSLGDAPEYSASDFDDAAWRNLDLPHDWSIESKSEISNPSQGDGGFFSNGLGWYRKTFFVPSHWEGQKVSIYFEGVYMNAEVFINGTSLGIQPYGYTSFNFDMTSLLKLGQDNVISVKVDNSKQKNSRWYSGSGIYRNVWLKVTNPLHIEDWGVAITTSEVSKETASVQVKSKVKNESDETQKVKLQVTLKSLEGNAISLPEKEYIIPVNEDFVFDYQIEVENPKLWSPETPNLYTAEFILRTEDNEILDEFSKDFGIRSIEFSVENGFVLNGEKVLINGGCVHHDNGCLGAAAYNRAEERKVELLKTAGFNAVRISHNPPSEAFLEACDRLGLLVVDEAFDGWRAEKTPHDYADYFVAWWKHDLESMVLRDRNHPSIIMWSIGNEIIERTEPQAVETAKMLTEAVHELDATRPVTSAMTTWGQGWDIFDPLMAEHDVAGYNYQLHEAESDHERVPSRIIVNTESYPKNAFFIWNLVQQHNYIIGDFVWTAMDYLGESGIGRYYYPGEPHGEHWEANLYPWHGAYCGDIDLTGWRKPISHYRNMLYNDNESIYMAVKEPNPIEGDIRTTSWAVWPTWESWTWPGYEGKHIDVEVYSIYPKVRLYLNDEVVGEKSTTITEEFKATFTLPYQSGELKAVALDGEQEIENVILKTADKATKIKLDADRSTINADGQDLVYITVEIIDSEGIIDPIASNRLQFDISGPGVIVGVDNANLKDTDLYQANHRKAWNGRALVIVKSAREAGEIQLQVSAEGLETETVKIITN